MRANETYKAKTRYKTRDQTAVIAGRVVVGLATRKPSYAPFTLVSIILCYQIIRIISPKKLSLFYK